MLPDWLDHQVSLKLTLRYLKGARKQHNVVGGRWHHQSPPLNTSARLLATLLNMFLCKHWYILSFLLPFASRCLSAARPPPAAAAGDLLSLGITAHFASLPKFKGYLDSKPVALLSLLLGIRAEKKIGPRSHLAAAQKRAGPYHGAPAFVCFFLFDSSWSQTNSDMLVLLELLLAKSLGITSDCSLRQTTPAGAVQPLGLDVLLGSHHCQLFILFDVQQ